MKKMLVVVFSFMFLGLVGCASSGKVSSAEQVKTIVIETVPKGDQPNWVKDGKEYFKENSKMYYVSVTEGYTNLEASKRASYASVQTKVAEQVKNIISVEVGRVIEANNNEDTTGGYLKNVFISNVERLEVSGIVVEATYSEKIQEIKGTDNKVFWRTYTLASIPESSYNNLIAKAFSDTSKQVSKNKSAKELLKKAEERFYGKD